MSILIFVLTAGSALSYLNAIGEKALFEVEEGIALEGRKNRYKYEAIYSDNLQ